MTGKKQPEESFKVIDRRPFTAEGELRKEVLEQEKREQEAAAAAQKVARPAPGPAPAGGPSSIAASEKPPGAPRDAGAEAPKPSHSFQMLIDFLARNAAAMLGGFPDPRTGDVYVELEGTREVIDMLDALREKTRGNLAPEDDRLLVEVLGSLKLSYLEVSKAATQTVKEKVKS